MNVELISIGDELLQGQTTNTNAAWLAEALFDAGHDVVRGSVIPDTVAVIASALERSFEHADLTIVTGGLGPTHDDCTREALAAFLDVPLEEDASVRADLEAYYGASGRSLTEARSRLALVPATMEPLSNPVGTAPGLLFDGMWQGVDRRLIALPGVPQEMKGIFAEEIRTLLDRWGKAGARQQRTLRTSGIGESSLQELLEGLPDELPDGVTLAYLPKSGEVTLRLVGRGRDADQLKRVLDVAEASVRERVAPHLYGVGEVVLAEEVGRLLREGGQTLGIAESCTGGLLADRVTDVPGSSSYFVGGVVAYCNAIKHDVLGVESEALDRWGAVSEQVACQMAEGVLSLLDTDLGVSTTGIAGPSGGTPEKPVGTVWIGLATREGVQARRYQFGNDRRTNKERTVAAVLDGLRRHIEESVRL